MLRRGRVKTVTGTEAMLGLVSSRSHDRDTRALQGMCKTIKSSRSPWTDVAVILNVYCSSLD